MTIEQYLTNKGFIVTKSQASYRLSRSLDSMDDNLFKYVCNVREKYIGESNVLNNPESSTKDISGELEMIGRKTFNELKKIKNKVKNSR